MISDKVAPDILKNIGIPLMIHPNQKWKIKIKTAKIAIATIPEEEYV